MRFQAICIVVSILLGSCQPTKKSPEEAQKVVSVTAAIQVDTPISPIAYNLLLERCGSQKTRLSQAFSSAIDEEEKDSVRSTAHSYLFSILGDSVWPAWYGTPWDFNGISNEPQHGQIACGYFVSTTLKHIGFRLNRYKLAQQGATAICKAFSPKLHRFSSLEKLIQFLDSPPEQFSKNQIYVLGLDYHVGFIEKHGEELYVTHSSFLAPGAVAKQPLATADVMLTSNSFVIAPLLTDNTIEAWLKGSQIYP